MNEIEKLTELFTQFPGIGPRQARRFVFFLLRKENGYSTMLIKSINDALQKVRQCSDCLRYTTMQHSNTRCRICSDTQRTQEQLMLVEKDTDIDQMEKSGAYTGMYIVLGGNLSLTGKKGFIREKELFTYLKNHKNTFNEIILALSATPDGEYTADYLITKFKETEGVKESKITVLGRGLSTGSELEYADSTTLVQAMKNRK